jgi:hypothetical protein
VKRARRPLLVLLCFALASRLSAAAAPGNAPAFGNAPYEAEPVQPERIRVTIDFSAAEQVLDALSQDKPKPGDASALRALAAVRDQIAASGKDSADWDRDFAGAFSEESRPSSFDLRSIRLDRDRWRVAIAGLEENADKIARLASRRAAALLPTDAPVRLSCDVELTFAMAGLEDHAVSHLGDERIRILIDVGGTVSSSTGDTPEERSDALARLVAGETFRAAWDRYRALAPGWQKPGLGVIDPLARALTIAAPVFLYAFDRNFFPLAKWLHDPMLLGIDALNHEATVLLDPKTDLSQRAEILASLRKPGLRGDPALGAAAFLADGVFQRLGYEELLRALAAGPSGLLQAYARASGKGSNLPPLSEALRKHMPER